jgi:hypothetical protein
MTARSIRSCWRALPIGAGAPPKRPASGANNGPREPSPDARSESLPPNPSYKRKDIAGTPGCRISPWSLLQCVSLLMATLAGQEVLRRIAGSAGASDIGT